MIISDFYHLSNMPAVKLNECSCYAHFDPRLKMMCIHRYEQLRKIKKEERDRYFKIKQMIRDHKEKKYK